MIQLRGVRKEFGSRIAVDNLDLAVPRGAIFGLLGHNGAGKSTTIGMLLGQVWPTAGEVRVCEHDVFAERPLALARVGAIFESPVFYDYLSGWRNLQILASYTARTSDARLREVIDWVGLAGRETSLVRSYSHGMRARLALAQALLPAPELLILDEPTNGLDPPQIAALRPILQRYAATGRTVVVSSHLLAEVEQTCSHVVVMHAGKVLVAGAVSDLGVAGDRHLEEVFLETIAGAAGLTSRPDEDPEARGERLRQVRAR